MSKLIPIILIFLASCQLLNHKEPKTRLNAIQVENFSQANELFNSGDFKEAAYLYDQISYELQDPKYQDYFIMMLFNSGSSYREAGDCKTSLTRYRKLLDLTISNIKFKSRALLEISYTYSCLNKNKLSLLSLKDLESIKQGLGVELKKTVYPARVALAYAQTKENKLIDLYRAQALNGILFLRKSDKVSVSDLSRLFYFMGRIYGSKLKLKAASMHQSFLLQSIFLQDNVWSKKSRYELKKLFKILKKAQVKTLIKEGKKLIDNEKSPLIETFYRKITRP